MRKDRNEGSSGSVLPDPDKPEPSITAKAQRHEELDTDKGG
jgi:hypothetical protein